ncbi:MAG: tetratricopeptide repeat protein [Bacteroidetes bacterium]|nr:MAG: tetratricopeptide repeat protein [Bacteroidota bacterium]
MRLILICLGLLLALIGTGRLPAQTLPQTLAFAEAQLALGQYETAIKAYRRVLYFGGDSVGSAVFAPLADCYLATGQARQAQRYFNLAYAQTRDDSLRNELLFRKVAALLLAGQDGLAEVDLLSVQANTPYFRQKLAFYEGVTAFQREDFDRAERAFLQAIDSVAFPGSPQVVRRLFAEQARLRRFNPRKVRWMSVFLPGLGQLYVGEYRYAANSLLLTGGLMALFGYVFVNLSLIDALFSVMPWFQRYYIGGYQHAYRLAEEKIQGERHRIFQQLLDEMTSQIPGKATD